MTPEQQLIAMAKACPTLCYNDVYQDCYRWRDGWGRSGNRFDPLNDLNAMHEAEKVLTDEQWYDWFDVIRRVIGYSTPVPPADYTERIMIQKATAAQRAEAFLRTLKLWTD